MLLVFGSLNVDLVFQLEALPRPGETVLCPGYALAAGGKGANQAAAAAKAGAAVRMVGQVGDDDFGRFVTGALAAAGVDGAGIGISAKPTGIAVIGVDRRAENQIMVASGANLDTDAGQIDDAGLAPGVTVLCQNEIRPEATFALLERAKRAGRPHDPEPRPGRALPGRVLDALDVLVVNQIEAATAAGAGGGSPPLWRGPGGAPWPDLRGHPRRRGRARDRAGGRLSGAGAGGRAGRHHRCWRCLRGRPRRRPRSRLGAARGATAGERRRGARLHPDRRPDQPARRGRDRGRARPIARRDGVAMSGPAPTAAPDDLTRGLRSHVIVPGEHP